MIIIITQKGEDVSWADVSFYGVQSLHPDLAWPPPKIWKVQCQRGVAELSCTLHSDNVGGGEDLRGCGLYKVSWVGLLRRRMTRWYCIVGTGGHTGKGSESPVHLSGSAKTRRVKCFMQQTVRGM